VPAIRLHPFASARESLDAVTVSPLRRGENVGASAHAHSRACSQPNSSRRRITAPGDGIWDLRRAITGEDSRYARLLHETYWLGLSFAPNPA
jgi:hypothetical protein